MDNTNNTFSKNDLLEKNIESTMDTIGKTTVWIIASIVVIALSIPKMSQISQPGDFKPFGVEIPLKRAGILMFCFLFGINFYFYKLFYIIKSNYSESGDKVKIKFILQRYPIIANPFSKSGEGKANLIDNLGYPIYFFLWWIAFALAIRMSFFTETLEAWIIIAFFSVLYAVLGRFTGIIVNSFIDEITISWQRKFLANTAIFIGIIFLIIINWSPAIEFFSGIPKK